MLEWRDQVAEACWLILRGLHQVQAGGATVPAMPFCVVDIGSPVCALGSVFRTDRSVVEKGAAKSIQRIKVSFPRSGREPTVR
jgi:hypothetical protein